MLNQNFQIGISVDSHKLAALFFDYILPTNSMLEIPSQVIFSGADLPEQLNHFMMSYMEYVSNRIKELVKAGVPTEKIEARALEDAQNYNIAQKHKYLTAKGFRSVPLFTSSAAYNSFLSQGKKQSVEFNIMGIPLISTKNLSWEQVLEIREDSDFSNKLRRLRIFLNKNYLNKSREFIVDDISVKIDEYEKACKKHGLDLVMSTLSKILESKSLLAAVGISTVGILTGNPKLVDIAVISGTAIEIGKISLHIAEKQLGFESSAKDSDIAYLYEIKEKNT